MPQQDTQTINAELAEVISLYSKQFGHPPGDRVPSTKYGRAPLGEVLSLAKEALATGEPVKGWAEAYVSPEETDRLRKAGICAD